MLCFNIALALRCSYSKTFCMCMLIIEKINIYFLMYFIYFMWVNLTKWTLSNVTSESYFTLVNIIVLQSMIIICIIFYYFFRMQRKLHIAYIVKDLHHDSISRYFILMCIQMTFVKIYLFYCYYYCYFLIPSDWYCSTELCSEISVCWKLTWKVHFQPPSTCLCPGCVS